MEKENISRTDWEGSIFDELVEMLEVSHGDAQGIFEAHDFEMMQEWTKGSTPSEAALRLANL